MVPGLYFFNSLMRWLDEMVSFRKILDMLRETFESGRVIISRQLNSYLSLELC